MSNIKNISSVGKIIFAERLRVAGIFIICLYVYDDFDFELDIHKLIEIFIMLIIGFLINIKMIEFVDSHTKFNSNEGIESLHQIFGNVKEMPLIETTFEPVNDGMDFVSGEQHVIRNIPISRIEIWTQDQIFRIMYLIRECQAFSVLMLGLICTLDLKIGVVATFISTLAEHLIRINLIEKPLIRRRSEVSIAELMGEQSNS